MFFGLKQQPKLLDEESIAWMFDVFAWAQTNFGNHELPGDTVLIFPNNEHFPGRENSLEGMAALIFSQVKNYAGFATLPCELQNETGVSHAVTPNSEAAELTATSDDKKLIFTYHTQTLNDPEVLIASFIHQITYYIVGAAHNPPPGGNENWPHVAELLAVFMGFGIIMANSANTQKIRSCSSCSGPAVERESFLSQYDMTYALAIFCVLKNIPQQVGAAHLKKTLRAYYKKAYREISRNATCSNDKLKLLQATYSQDQSNVIQENH